MGYFVQNYIHSFVVSALSLHHVTLTTGGKYWMTTSFWNLSDILPASWYSVKLQTLHRIYTE